jgi:hypothetical protein
MHDAGTEPGDLLVCGHMRWLTRGIKAVVAPRALGEVRDDKREEWM